MAIPVPPDTRPYIRPDEVDKFYIVTDGNTRIAVDLKRGNVPDLAGFAAAGFFIEKVQAAKLLSDTQKRQAAVEAWPDGTKRDDELARIEKFLENLAAVTAGESAQVVVDDTPAPEKPAPKKKRAAQPEPVAAAAAPAVSTHTI